MVWHFSTLIFGNDHAGVALKHHLLKRLQEHVSTPSSLSIQDLGPGSDQISVDYPDQVDPVAKALLEPNTAGILICGSGVGMAMAANRFGHLRAVRGSDPFTVHLARTHNNANVLALGERLIGQEMAWQCLLTFLETPFEGGRHARRVEKLDLFRTY